MTGVRQRGGLIVIATLFTAFILFYTGPAVRDYYGVQNVGILPEKSTAAVTEPPILAEDVKPTDTSASEKGQRPKDPEPGSSRPGESEIKKPKPEEKKLGKPRPEEPKPDETKAEEPILEDPKPEESKPGDQKPEKTATADIHDTESTSGEGLSAEEKTAEETAGEKAHDTANSFSVGRLHYLIPASKKNLHFCYHLVSSLANRWPVPSILGWHETGDMDAHITHLAKLRVIERYLDSLSAEEDDDLTVIVDGYDILLQLPPEIMIERYFDTVDRADAHLAKRFGVSVKEARSRGLHQTIFWGPDKICFPIKNSASRCWAVPKSSLPPHAFGPKQGNGEMRYNDVRWLNSGTVMGKISHMRRLIKATMEEIDATYDEHFDLRNSDQYYVANVWGRQEYYRSKVALNGREPDGPEDKEIPKKRYKNQTTEYNIAIDYESALFQTRAGYEPFNGYLRFNVAGLSARMDVDMFEQGDDFTPFNIPMPANVYSALGKLWESIPEVHKGLKTDEWVRTLKLGTNYVTKHIWPLWHCTGPKEAIKEEVPKMWWWPYSKTLVRATTKAYKHGELITKHLVNGRQWASKNLYPEDMNDELGGVWVDHGGATFVEWNRLCGDFEPHLFGGEYPELLAGLASQD